MFIRKLIIAAFLVFLSAGYSYAGPAVEGHSMITGMPNVITLMVIGVFVGAVGTFMGAGGGFLVVPILIICYGFSPQHAIGTSMAVVFLNALSGTFSYVSQKRVDFESGAKFSVAAVPGVIIGALFAQTVSQVFFSIVFALLLMSIAYVLYFVKAFRIVTESAIVAPQTRHIYDSSGQVHVYAFDLSVGMTGSFIIGGLSGFFGIGGGLIHVPLMSFIGMPIHVATATSHFVIAITSFFGVIAFIALRTIDIDYAVFLGVGSILGAHMGASVSALTSSGTVKRCIAAILVLVSVNLIYSVL